MCDEDKGLEVFADVLHVAYTGVMERIEAGITDGWRLPEGIAEHFRSKYAKTSSDYRALCYQFIERVEFPPEWNNLDQIKFFGDVVVGERDARGVLIFAEA